MTFGCRSVREWVVVSGAEPIKGQENSDGEAGVVGVVVDGRHGVPTVLMAHELFSAAYKDDDDGDGPCEDGGPWGDTDNDGSKNGSCGE